MSDPNPAEPDVNRPSAARVYDYWLGGSNNFAADREVGRTMAEMEPRVPLVARANRAFLRRAVLWLAAQGVDQFLDLGSGIPTADNVHWVAREVNPDAKVAYVDNDPVAVAYSVQLLAKEAEPSPNVTFTEGDLRQPQAVLDAPGVAGLLDFSRPVGLLVLSVMQYQTIENPGALLAEYCAALAPGSYLALSHISDDHDDLDYGDLVKVNQALTTPGRPRKRHEVAELFGETELVPPGLVWVGAWRPDDANAEVVPGILGGVARIG